MEQNYYAVERSGNELQHYGVKGMKWGVRKAIQSGNDKALSRQFKKASKKLAKLEKRGASGKKYAKRAAKLAAGGAALGAAGALGSFENIGKVNKAISNASKKAIKSVKNGNLSSKAGSAIGRAAGKANEAIEAYGKWGSEKLSKHTGNVTRHGAIRVGSMAAGAGLLGAAGYNAYRAATAGKNRKKAAQFKAEMNKAFAGTKYANGGSVKKTSGKSKKRRSSAQA